LESIATRRRCSNPECKAMSNRAKVDSQAITFSAYRCQKCGDAGVPICERCFHYDEAHDAASAAVNNRRTKSGAKASRKKLLWTNT